MSVVSVEISNLAYSFKTKHLSINHIKTITYIQVKFRIKGSTDTLFVNIFKRYNHLYLLYNKHHPLLI